MDGLRRTRVLIVEDNVDTAESFACLLNNFGYRTVIARDGLEAVEQSASFEPHLILMDLVLPVLDGFEACRRIRQKYRGAPPTIAAVTGLGRVEDRRRGEEVGFDHFLVKPVPIEVIQSLLPAERRRP